MGRLTDEELRRFANDGYLLIPDVVPESLMQLADVEVDAFLAEPDRQAEASVPGAGGWSPPVSRLPRCENLLNLSPARELAEALVAPNCLDLAFGQIQIATTVPPFHHVPGGPHIDGHSPGTAPKSFTMLAGVLLTDQRASWSGNLWVWPGSHLDHQTLFNDRGAGILLEHGGHPTLLEPPLISTPATEVKGNRGDLFLAHYLLGHNKGGNRAEWVRRTIYYRLVVPDHAARWEQTFFDIWTEYPPVRRAISSAG